MTLFFNNYDISKEQEIIDYIISLAKDIFGEGWDISNVAGSRFGKTYKRWACVNKDEEFHYGRGVLFCIDDGDTFEISVDSLKRFIYQIKTSINVNISDIDYRGAGYNIDSNKASLAEAIHTYLQGQNVFNDFILTPKNAANTDSADDNHTQVNTVWVIMEFKYMDNGHWSDSVHKVYLSEDEARKHCPISDSECKYYIVERPIEKD